MLVDQLDKPFGTGDLEVLVEDLAVQDVQLQSREPKVGHAPTQRVPLLEALDEPFATQQAVLVFSWKRQRYRTILHHFPAHHKFDRVYQVVTYQTFIYLNNFQ